MRKALDIRIGIDTGTGMSTELGMDKGIGIRTGIGMNTGLGIRIGIDTGIGIDIDKDTDKGMGRGRGRDIGIRIGTGRSIQESEGNRQCRNTPPLTRGRSSNKLGHQHCTHQPHCASLRTSNMSHHYKFAPNIQHKLTPQKHWLLALRQREARIEIFSFYLVIA